MKTSENRKALFIGIDTYHKKPLRACVNDASAMKEVLEAHEDGEPDFSSSLATNLTGANFRAKILKFLKSERSCQHGLLYFSGHGYVDNTGGYLVGRDFNKEDIGVKMEWLVEQLNQSDIPEITVILDCCHADDFGREAGTEKRITYLRDNVTLLAATKWNDVASEREGHGVFTKILLQGLKGAAADAQGNITASGLYNMVDSLLSPWQQRPVFKSSITQMSVLRTSIGDVERECLQQLNSLDFFHKRDRKIQLRPKHITIDPIAQPRRAQFMSNLLRFYRAGLLECPNKMSPYEAAIQGSCCELSVSGQFFWDLLDKNQF